MTESSTFSSYDVLMQRDYYSVLEDESNDNGDHGVEDHDDDKKTAAKKRQQQQHTEKHKKTAATARKTVQKSGNDVVDDTTDEASLRRSRSTGHLHHNHTVTTGQRSPSKRKPKSTGVSPSSPHTSPSLKSASQSFYIPNHTTMKISSSKKAFQETVQLWKREGWPVQLLFEDPTSARLLQDNAVFTAISFYGHQWKWDKQHGFMLNVACGSSNNGSNDGNDDDDNNDNSGRHRSHKKNPMKLVPWNDIKDNIEVIDAAGWLVFDGVYYGMNGLEGIENDNHMWKWKHLPIAYRYPKNKCPGYAYFEIISCSWEHAGFPGFGLERPHGHVSVEFCDPHGNVYSVGQYPDPKGMGSNKMGTIYLTTLGVLMATDPYISSRGEKSVHRYHLGTGARGQHNFELLKAHVENIQRCGVLHNGLANNCSDFARALEQFVRSHCNGATLFDLHKERHFLPLRDIRPRPARLTKKGSRQQRLKSSAVGIYATMYHYVMLFFISIILTLLALLPFSTRLGRGRGVDISAIPTEEIIDERDESDQSDDDDDDDAVVVEELHEQLSNDLADMYDEKTVKNYGALRNKWISPLWPRKVRLAQLYGPMRLHSALFISQSQRSKQ